MEFAWSGCPIPDIVIGDTCVISSLGASFAIPIAIGVVLLIIALFRRSDRTQQFVETSSEDQAQAFAMDQLGRTLRSLIAVAAADGRLDDMEVQAIRYVGAKHFGLDFPEEMIRELYAEMGAKIDVKTEVEGNLGGLSLKEPTAVEALVKGMIVVAAADGDLAESEKVLLQQICDSLGLDKEVVEAVFAGADELARKFREERGTTIL